MNEETFKDHSEMLAHANAIDSVKDLIKLSQMKTYEEMEAEFSIDQMRAILVNVHELVVRQLIITDIFVENTPREQLEKIDSIAQDVQSKLQEASQADVGQEEPPPQFKQHFNPTGRFVMQRVQ